MEIIGWRGEGERGGGEEILCGWKQSSLIYRIAYILRVLRSRDSTPPPLPLPRDPRVHGRGNTIEGAKTTLEFNPYSKSFHRGSIRLNFLRPPFFDCRKKRSLLKVESRSEDATVELLSRKRMPRLIFSVELGSSKWLSIIK